MRKIFEPEVDTQAENMAEDTVYILKNGKSVVLDVPDDVEEVAPDACDD